MVLIMIAIGWSAYNPYQLLIVLVLTTTPTFTATRDSTYGAAVVGATLRFTVIEFYPGVFKSIQKGVTAIATSAASGTTTVTAVNTAKSVLITLGFPRSTAIPSISPSAVYSDIVLTNSTTVTASRVTADATYSCNHSWMLLEFY